jgi:hypothetical protein
MIKHEWKLAEIGDTNDIVSMAQRHFETEIDVIFTPSVPTMTRNVTFAIMNQIYYPGSEMITVCRAQDDNKLLAYTWAKSNDRACWSDDPMICVRMAHVDLSLSARERVKMVQDMMTHWEKLAAYSGNMIICSTTMRHDQAGFLRLHERAGYSVRGSYAYKRLASRDSLQS